MRLRAERLSRASWNDGLLLPLHGLLCRHPGNALDLSVSGHETSTTLILWLEEPEGGISRLALPEKPGWPLEKISNKDHHE
jgi:hypothetical protein